MSEFGSRLSRMQEAWTAGKKGAAGVPDGLYAMQLQECELRESNSGKLMIHRVHLIADGEYAGETIRDNIVLESEYGPRMAAEFCTQMGHEAPENAEELENIVAAISGANPAYTARVRKAKDSDFRNIRIMQVTSEGEGNGNGTPAPASSPKPKSKAVTAKKVTVTPPLEPEEVHRSDVSEGDTVSFDNGAGVLFQGTLKTAKGSKCDVEVTGREDENENGVYELDTESLTKVEAEVEAGEDTTELLAFCQSHDIECDESTTADELKEKINGFAWKEEEITAEEKTLLEGIGTVIEKPKPMPKAKPAPAAKKSPAKPAAKAVPAKRKK